MKREMLKRWSKNDLSVDIRQQWINHIGGLGPSLFPRDIGFPERYSCESVPEMINMVEDRMSSSNSYIQVFSDIQQQSDVYDTCYIDIDAEIPFEPDEEDREYRTEIWKEQLEDAWWETQKYAWYMEQAYNADLRIYFSGSRGFSIYVDFEPIQSDFGAVVAQVKETIHESDVDWEMVDESVFEKNRISRLPYTVNWNNMEKRGLRPKLCLPVDSDWSFSEVISEIQQPQRCLEVERNPSSNIVREYIQSRENAGDYESREIESETGDAKPARALEEVQLLMSLSKYISDGRHRILHFMLVPALIEAGWEDTGKIHEVCEEFIEATGAAYHPTYSEHVDKSIRRTLEGPAGSDGYWKPWSIQTFLEKNPELLRHFDASMLD